MSAVRRLAKAIGDPAQQSAQQPVPQLIFTAVSAVTPSGSADGLAAAFVAINADNVPAPYNAGYTPTVGDHVAVLLVGGSPLIICKIVGYPNI